MRDLKYFSKKQKFFSQKVHSKAYCTPPQMSFELKISNIKK